MAVYFSGMRVGKRELAKEMQELYERLDETFKDRDSGNTWLMSSSGYFGGNSPINALLAGRVDLVHAALEALDSGSFV